MLSVVHCPQDTGLLLQSPSAFVPSIISDSFIENFEAYTKYLKLGDYRVIAPRDLQEYVDPNVIPADADAVIAARRKSVEAESNPQ